MAISRAKTVEPIEMPFGRLTRIDPVSHRPVSEFPQDTIQHDAEKNKPKTTEANLHQ